MLGVLVNCQREEASQVANESSGDNLRQSEHTYPTNVQELSDNEISPISAGINHYEGMLWFRDYAFFNEVMGSLINHEESVLDSWERLIGFSSLRSYYNNLEVSEEVDDADLDLERIPDRAFESVLNIEGKIRIGDSIYKVDYKRNVIYSWHYQDSVNKQEHRIMQVGDWVNYQTYCSRVINGGKNRIRGTKWVRNFLFYGSVGARTNYYKKNWRGKWKKAKASEIHLLLDQWSYLRYWIENGPPPCNDPILWCTVTNYHKGKNKAKKVEHVFRYVVIKLNFGNNNNNNGSSGSQKIHVVEFGRIHHWTTNYNNDCHTNAW